MLVQDWNTIKNQNEPFVRFAKKCTTQLDSLHLNWLKVNHYKGGKLGGWVSEHYMCFCRVMKWVYSGLDVISSNTNDVIDRWTICQCNTWLKSRNIKHPKGKVVSLQRFIRKYITDHPNEMDIELLTQMFGSSEDISLTISSLNAMISRIMCERCNSTVICDVDRHIKLFLSNYAELDEKIDPERKVPSWISSYNFMSLLNIPDSMKLYGPLRNLSELDVQGEGYIRHAKAEIPHVYSKHWHYNCMKNIYVKSMMDLLWKNHTGKELFTYDELKEKKKSCKQYNSFGEVFNLFNSELPISVMILPDSSLFVWLKSSETIQLQRMSWNCSIYDLNYHQWSMRNTTSSYDSIQMLEHATAGVMLPQLIKRTRKYSYAVIDCKWREILKDGNIGLPQIKNVIYD